MNTLPYAFDAFEHAPTCTPATCSDDCPLENAYTDGTQDEADAQGMHARREAGEVIPVSLYESLKDPQAPR